MSGTTLKFSDLVPEDRDLFELEDGTQVPFRTQQDFGAVDVARFRRLETEFREVETALRDSGQADEAAGAKLDELATEMVLMLLPDAPEAVIAELGLLPKERILNFWYDRNPVLPDQAGQGNSRPAPAKPKRGRRATSRPKNQ